MVKEGKLMALPTQDAINKKLFTAIVKNDINDVKKAFEDGAEASARTSGNYSTLHLAAEHAGTKILDKIWKELGNRGKNYINQPGTQSTGQPPLAIAAKENTPEAVKWIAEHGADLNQKHNMDNPDHHYAGMTAVHEATMEGNGGNLRILHEAGADLEAATKDGSRPLHFAAYSTENALTTLLELGANPKAKNIQGEKPVDLLISPKIQESARLLLNAADKATTKEAGFAEKVGRATARLPAKTTERYNY